MPPHVHYVEPYFGGGAVLLAKDPEGVSEVVNDINGELTNFWDCLRHEASFRAMKRLLEATPFSAISFADSLRDIDNPPGSASPVDRALQFFARYRQSRQGLGKDFATLSRNRTRRGMNEQVSSWLTAIEGLPEAHARLKRVVILNDDALKVIEQEDGPNTHFYCDPTYLHHVRVTTNDYEFEMSEEDHDELLKTLSQVRGTFQLSGYRSEMYDDYAERYNWRRSEFDLPNNASGKKKKERKTECVWMNYAPPAEPEVR